MTVMVAILELLCLCGACVCEPSSHLSDRQQDVLLVGVVHEDELVMLLLLLFQLTLKCQFLLVLLLLCVCVCERQRKKVIETVINSESPTIE